MNNSVTYSAENNIAVRFYNHACLGLQKNIQDHSRNFMEKIGDAGLWPLENIPTMALDAVRDPRVVTIGLTSLAMLGDSFAFYPDETTCWLKAAWALVPIIPFWAMKFSAYISTVEIISSYGLRAEGRFANNKLMDQFYGKDVDK